MRWWESRKREVIFAHTDCRHGPCTWEEINTITLKNSLFSSCQRTEQFCWMLPFCLFLVTGLQLLLERGCWEDGRKNNESIRVPKFGAICPCPLNCWSGFWGVGPNVPELCKTYTCMQLRSEMLKYCCICMCRDPKCGTLVPRLWNVSPTSACGK